MTNNIEQFYTEWTAQLDRYLNSYFYNPQGKKYRTRNAYLKAEYYLSRLLDGTLEESEKIIILPGIRGVGKTTLLSQLYFFEKYLNPNRNLSLCDNKGKLNRRIYISADKLLINGISLANFLDYLENNVWGSLIDTDHKTLILIDEIQYDEKWALFLKLLYDKIKGHRNVLIVATGSAALLLNKKNKDLVRRSITERIFPTKFNEYLTLHKKIFPEKGLSREIVKSVFESDSAEEVFSSMKKLRPRIINSLSKIEEFEYLKKDYLLRGSFPFSAEMGSHVKSLERIKEMILTNIIQKDLILSGDFDSETLVKIPDALFLLANSSEISVGTLCSTLKLNNATIQKILKALSDAELVFEVLPYGQPYKQVKKSSKYLFLSPNIRAGLLGGIIGTDLKGALLEDYCAFIFAKEFSSDTRIYYDYAKGGADFILRFNQGSEIVVEVGFNKKQIEQVKKTMEKTSGRSKYGLIIGGEELDLVNGNIVKIPLNYFFLI